MKSIAFSVFALIIAGAAGVTLGAGLGKPDSAPIPMKEMSQFGEVWTKGAARMPDDHKAWKLINQAFSARRGLMAADKQERLAAVYALARSGQDPGTQALAADPLLEADIPEVTRELLLHPIPGIAAAAAQHLSKPAAGVEGRAPGTAPEPARRDTQAVPFLIYVLNRNNYLQSGSEEAALHMRLKLHLISAIMYITQADDQVDPADIGDEENIDRVLALARKWTAEKGLEPLEKQRPPKAEPPTDAKPAPAPTVPSGAKAAGPTGQPAPSPGAPKSE